MTHIAVIVPTRGRPGNAARLAAAFRETTSLGAVPVFVVDQDDPLRHEYERDLRAGHIPRMLVPERPGSLGMVYALNYAAHRYAELYDVLGFMGDDHLPRTHGWDQAMADACKGPEPRLAYGNDLLQGAALPTAVFMQSRLVRAMGVMAPVSLRHLYVDNFWLELGRRLGGISYLPEVVIEHIHPAAGKTPMDDGYRRVNAPEVDSHDRNEWTDYRDGGRLDDLVRQVRKEYGL